MSIYSFPSDIEHLTENHSCCQQHDVGIEILNKLEFDLDIKISGLIY